MTGPEHYRRAEEYLEASKDDSMQPQGRAELREAAQVHATLALAAATALDPMKSRLTDIAWKRVAAGVDADEPLA